MIKPREGQCLDCSVGTTKKLMAKRCFEGPFFHYQKHKQKQYAAKKKSNKPNSADKITLGKWFNTQISMLPASCENCEEPLNKFAPWSARAYIAHIVPKKHFKSVETHPLNRLFLCIDCHTNYDNWLSRDIVKMPVSNLAISRFKTFMENIHSSEIVHLKPFLKAVYFGEK